MILSLRSQFCLKLVYVSSLEVYHNASPICPSGTGQTLHFSSNTAPD